jgi:hypothetical protein
VRLVVVFSDGVAQEIVALFGAIAFESLAVALFIDGVVHGVAHGFGQGFGDIADAAADEVFGSVGIGFGEGFDATSDFWEQVSRFEFEVVFVDVGHDVRRMMNGCAEDASGEQGGVRGFHQGAPGPIWRQGALDLA